MATTNLTKTPATAGNRNKWTWSAWVKRSTTGSASSLFGVHYSSGAYQDNLYFQSSGKLDWFIWNNNAYAGRITTDRLFRDVSAWYHVVCVYDNTLATATDRMKLYVNGVRETSLSNVTNPVQNSTLSNVNTTNPFILGNDGNGNNHFDGSMTHVHFIDGLTYDASTFGETDATTGIWKPKTAPVVTYGTNGFFLKFENSASFGTDSSGNANNFTVNGTMTQTIDTPSNVFATLNPLINVPNQTYANGNTKCTDNDNAHKSNYATLGFSSGKYYWEAKAVGGSKYTIGLSDAENQSAYQQVSGANLIVGDNSNSYLKGDAIGWYYTTLYKNGSTVASSIHQIATNDIMMIACDADSGKIYYGVNGTWRVANSTTFNSADNDTTFTTGKAYTPAFSAETCGWETNFGNGYFGTTAVSSAENPDDGIGIFEYEVPTGYKALCTKSINAQEYD